jgi:asparagine N-glycosylation enzyme membrane subunit Stt3
MKKKARPLPSMSRKFKNVIAYEGPFFIHILTVFSKYVKILTRDYPDASKKIYKIFFELTQNITYYSAEINEINQDNRTGVGKFSLDEDEKYYYFSTTNRVLKEHGEILKNRCNYINSLDSNNLRELKREQRILSQGEKLGAHIGLMQAALISNFALKVEIRKINREYSMYTLMVTLDKI